MKIIGIGDFHGKFPKNLKQKIKKEKPDLILCTGDLGGSENLLKIIFKYFEGNWEEEIGEKKAKKYILEDYKSGVKILKELNKLKIPVYIIEGNWDFYSNSKNKTIKKLNLKNYKKIIQGLENLTYWNRGIKKINKLRILAFGGMVTAQAYLIKGNRPEESRKKAIKKNKKEEKQILKNKNKKADILFTHYTPYKYFDKIKSTKENPMNNKNVGFTGFTKYIKKENPLLSISGHMHEYQGIKKLEKTTIIATGSAKEGKATIIEIDERNKTIKEIRFIK